MAVRAELFAQETLSGEIIVDNFAGGGGASSGIELALGRIVNAAINHDPAAILMHKTNHPYTEHYQASVWDINPREVCRGRPVALAWFSPDCKHFSKAKGAALVDKHIRGLAWITLRWAGTVRPGSSSSKMSRSSRHGARSARESLSRRRLDRPSRSSLHSSVTSAMRSNGGSWWPLTTAPPPPASGLC